MSDTEDIPDEDLRRLGRSGWRWVIEFDPALARHERYVCTLRRGSGPPPYGQYAVASGRSRAEAVRKALRVWIRCGHDKREPMIEAEAGDARRLALQLLADFG